MESDSWTRFAAGAASSRRHHQTRYGAEAPRDRTLRGWRDLFLGFEEIDAAEDDTRAEFPCPFCAEDFDDVGLRCHIDEEHPVEAKNEDLREGDLQALLGGSSFVAPPSVAPDPLLSSLIYKLPMGDSSNNVQPESFEEGNLIKDMPNILVDRVGPPLSDKDQEERARRIEFVRELLISTVFDISSCDNLQNSKW